MTTKTALRTSARALRAKLAQALPGFADILAGLADVLPLAADAPVASYWPLPSEADPRRLAAALSARGHPVLLPEVPERQGAPMVFREWREGDPLVRGPGGIYQPSAGAPARDPQAVLVPLLAYDRHGHRLGFGGGYYDRTLETLRHNRQVLAIGVAFSGQEVADLPCETHDQPLDMIVTESGLRHFGRSET